MRQSTQQYILGIMYDRRHGPLARAIKCLLWLVSQLYRFGVWTRGKLYSVGVFRQRPLGWLTISVGNITLGGTGKTPLVEALARALSERGRKVAILSRGYKSEKRPQAGESPADAGGSPRVVSDGQRIFLDAQQAGDEPYLLATNLDGVPILVDKNRVRAGQYAISHFGADTLILDDGFQYLALDRTHNLVLIDCTDPFGNGHLLPRGILREPLKSLRRASCFVLTKTNYAEVAPIKDRLREINPNAEILETAHEPLYLEDVISGRREGVELVRGKDVHVLSAIARPESFEMAVERLGGRIKRTIRFLDHHRFSQDEIEQVLKEAAADGAHAVVTTQKDAVRLPPLRSTPLPFFFLRVGMRTTAGAKDFADWADRLCQG